MKQNESMRNKSLWVSRSLIYFIITVCLCIHWREEIVIFQNKYTERLETSQKFKCGDTSLYLYKMSNLYPFI